MARDVTLSQLLPPDRVVVGMRAKTYKSAVAKLLDRLDAAGLLGDRAKVEALVDAEVAAGEIPTLGGGALLAHYRTDVVDQLALAVGTSRSAFAFAPPGASEARTLALIVAPRSAAKYYLKTVAALSRLLRDPDVADSIVNAKSVEEFLQIVRRHDVLIRPELVVQDLMSRRFQSVAPDMPLSDVVKLMVRHGRRAVPVVSDSGEVVGLVTQQEVLEQFLPQLLGTGALSAAEQGPLRDVKVRDVMQRSVMCLSEDQLISDVLSTTMSESGVPYFPVVREGKLVGFLSRTDLINKLLDPSV